MDEYVSALARADSVLLREALDLSHIEHLGGGVADEEPGKGETVTFFCETFNAFRLEAVLSVIVSLI